MKVAAVLIVAGVVMLAVATIAGLVFVWQELPWPMALAFTAVVCLAVGVFVGEGTK